MAQPARDPFVHQRLDESQSHVRLLEFRPSSIDEVHLSIKAYPLDEAPPFNAISYTWGGPGNERQVYIDGKLFYARLNCFNALRQARQHYPESLIWIDSICINQADLAEKSRQVQLIWHIYTKAQHVLSCVGDHQDESELLLPFIEELRKADFKLPRHRSDITPWVEWLPSLGLERVAQLARTYKNFSNRRYWRRLWVVQELAAKATQSQQPIRVLCGRSIIPWSDVILLDGILGMVVTQLYDRGVIDAPRQIHSALYKLVTFLRLDCEAGETLAVFGNFECMDPHDRIYGLLHLIDDGQEGRRIVPDYTLSIYELAKTVCEVSWYRNVDIPLEAFDIDHSHPEVRALVKQRTTCEENCVHSHGDTVIKLMDFYGYIHKEKGHSPSVELSLHTPDGLAAPLRREQRRVWHESANSELKRLHSGVETSALFLNRLPIALHSQDGDAAGILCHEAQPGDILVPIACRTPGILLVLRQSEGQVYDVIGQGILWDDFEVPDGPESAAKSVKIDLRLSVDDIVVLFAQDAVYSPRGSEELPRFDPESRLERLITKPVDDAAGGAHVTDWHWLNND